MFYPQVMGESKSIAEDNAAAGVHADPMSTGPVGQVVHTRLVQLADSTHMRVALPWIMQARSNAGPNDRNMISVFWRKERFSVLTTEHFCNIIPWVESEYIGTFTTKPGEVITSSLPVYENKIPHSLNINCATIRCAYRECDLLATTMCNSCLIVGYCGPRHASNATHAHVFPCARICHFMRAYQVNTANGHLCIRDSAVDRNLMTSEDVDNLPYKVIISMPYVNPSGTIPNLDVATNDGTCHPSS